MIFPALMPKMLDGYLNEKTFQSLFERLLKDPTMLLLFFETAAADETWCDRNPADVKQMVEWLNTQLLHRSLPLSFAPRAAKALREHHNILETHLPSDINIVLADAEVSANSLLLSANSSHFRERVERECRDRNTSQLLMKNITEAQFRPFITYARTGEIPWLYTASENELIEILRHAQDWKFAEVSEEAQRHLRKYLSKEQAMVYLCQSLKERWPIVAQAAIDIVNVNESGYSFILVADNALGLVVERVTEALGVVVAPLKEWITDLTCKDRVSGDLSVMTLASKLHRLNHVDLSGTASTPIFLDRLPTRIESLTLAECPWLSRDTIQKIAASYPQLETLSLASNSHLPSTFWSSLIPCKGVKNLDISGCYQIEDNDFIIALKSFQALDKLLIDRCTNVTDKGFSELARRGRRLVTLGISRCRITDRALIELAVNCSGLSSIDLSECRDITEKGIFEFVRNAKELQKINLERTHISQDYLDKIVKLRPNLAHVSGSGLIV